MSPLPKKGRKTNLYQLGRKVFSLETNVQASSESPWEYTGLVGVGQTPHRLDGEETKNIGNARSYFNVRFFNGIHEIGIIRYRSVGIPYGAVCYFKRKQLP